MLGVGIQKETSPADTKMDVQMRVLMLNLNLILWHIWLSPAAVWFRFGI